MAVDYQKWKALKQTEMKIEYDLSNTVENPRILRTNIKKTDSRLKAQLNELLSKHSDDQE